MEIYGAARVGLDLLANHTDIHIQRPLIAVERGAPDAREKLLSLDHAPSRLGQQAQDVELARRNVNNALFAAHAAHARIDSKLADRVHAVGLSRRGASWPAT